MKHTKLDKARAALILDQPFFASLLLPMPMIETTEVPTMATDGETILYNPEWIEGLSPNEIIFVLAHETLHCVFDHMGTRGNRSPNRWNQAADYVINQILKENKNDKGQLKPIGSMPVGGLYDPVLYAKGGGTAAGIYNLIPAENESKKAGEKGGALDQVHDTGTDNGKQKTDAATQKQKSAELKVRVVQARNVAKMQGNMSAGLERLIDDLVKPKFDWRELLRRFFTARAKTDFSFAKPKRRFLAEDIYLPSLVGERMGKIVIAVDCSGSINGKLLSEFAAEINAIREDLKPSGTDVIYFDSKVCKVDSIGDEEDFVIKPAGGGGTAFSPVIKHINAMEELPAAVVFLTDLECSDFGNAPDYPVMWCVLEKLNQHYKNVPYGEVVEVSVEDK